jgi:uncharacterized iron-regulated membrane protein
MSRFLLINIHMYLSAFFSAIVVLVALSGGLYLLGYKGNMETTPVGVIEGGEALVADPSKEAVLSALAQAGISDYDFDYVRASGSRLYTRPTSRTHYLLEVKGDQVHVTERRPDLQGKMIELHKGHGPSAFKIFQEIFAAGMVAIILSGLWLGLSAPRLRRQTALVSGAGLLVFGLLVLI